MTTTPVVNHLGSLDAEAVGYLSRSYEQVGVDTPGHTLRTIGN